MRASLQPATGRSFGADPAPFALSYSRASLPEEARGSGEDLEHGYCARSAATMTEAHEHLRRPWRRLFGGDVTRRTVSAVHSRSQERKRGAAGSRPLGVSGLRRGR